VATDLALAPLPPYCHSEPLSAVRNLLFVYAAKKQIPFS
jgi:hypothetical protein